MTDASDGLVAAGWNHAVVIVVTHADRRGGPAGDVFVKCAHPLGIGDGEIDPADLTDGGHSGFGHFPYPPNESCLPVPAMSSMLVPLLSTCWETVSAMLTASSVAPLWGSVAVEVAG